MQWDQHSIPDLPLLSTQMPFRGQLLTLILAVSFPAAGHAGAGNRQDQFVVAGYLPHYRVAQVAPESLKPLTDLIYFGLTPPVDGRLAEAPITPTQRRCGGRGRRRPQSPPRRRELAASAVPETSTECGF